MRRSPLKPSRGTVWPPAVREHVIDHQLGCIGPLAGMPGACGFGIEMDHVRASHATGMKSKSIATNAARLCNWHHWLKTHHGKTWRPRLLDVIRSLIRDCAACQEEWAREWAVAA